MLEWWEKAYSQAVSDYNRTLPQIWRWWEIHKPFLILMHVSSRRGNYRIFHQFQNNSWVVPSVEILTSSYLQNQQKAYRQKYYQNSQGFCHTYGKPKMISFSSTYISPLDITEGYSRELGLECCTNSFKDKRREGITNQPTGKRRICNTEQGVKWMYLGQTISLLWMEVLL